MLTYERHYVGWLLSPRKSRLKDELGHASRSLNFGLQNT